MNAALFRNYIKKYAEDEVLRKAAVITADNQDYTPVPSVLNGVVYKIRDSELETSYLVDVMLNETNAYDNINKEDIIFTCGCEMNKSGPCEHIAAVCMNADVNESMELVTGTKKFNPRHTIFADHHPFTKEDFEFFPEDMQKAIQQIISEDAINLTPGKNGKFRAIVKEAGKKHQLTFRKDKGSFIVHSSCTCNDTEHFMCVHKAAAWYMLKISYEECALEKTHDWSQEEDALLAEYDLTRENFIDEGYAFDFYLGDIELVLFGDDDEEENEGGQIQNIITFLSLKLAFFKLKDKRVIDKARELLAEVREKLSGSEKYDQRDVSNKAREMFDLLKKELPAPHESDIPEKLNYAHNILESFGNELPSHEEDYGPEAGNIALVTMDVICNVLPNPEEKEEDHQNALEVMEMAGKFPFGNSYDEEGDDFAEDDTIDPFANELSISEDDNDERFLHNINEMLNAFKNLIPDNEVDYEEDYEDDYEDIIDTDYEDKERKQELGFIFRIHPRHEELDLLNLAPVYGLVKKDRSAHRKPLNAMEYVSSIKSWLTEKEARIINTLPDDKKVKKYLNRLLKYMPDEGQWFAMDMNSNLRKALSAFSKEYLDYIDKLIHHLEEEYVYYSSRRPKRNPFTSFNTFDVLNPGSIQYLTSEMKVTTENEQITAHLKLYVDGEPLTHDITQAFFPVWFSMHNGEILLWKNHYHFMLACYFGFKQDKVIMLSPDQWIKVQEEVIVDLQDHVSIHIEGELQPVIHFPQPKCRIKLSETGDFLLLTPVFVYHDKEIPFNHTEDTLSYVEDGRINIIQRDAEAEQEFRTFIGNLHPKFNTTSLQEYYFLRSAEVMKQMWFFDFYEKCKEKGIEVYGTERLKRLKFNPNRPSTQYSVSSKTDWFDIDMNVQFGNQTATIKNIQKAVMKNEQYVELSDNSWGILPEEWLEKWSELIKFGKVQKGALKISKLHFQFIDKMYQELEQKDIKQEIDDKKALLDSFEQIEPIPNPEGLKAELRNYQQAGLNWLGFLVKYKWGGILADDMGLGKTIQILALFQHLKNHRNKHSPVFLVIAPTTLLFNWENEISKFVPDMKYTLHWGPKRDTNTDTWQEQDIILTTYGTLTSDIGWMKDFPFTVAVLDESQSIKNPASKRFKAVSLVNASYRFTLTGTPIENNTMELFAQIEFVNPGFLGTQNFFKQEFAVPIDKNNDKQKLTSLKQMVKPFILRRTKERVAEELPSKTETPLICGMEPEQREVYEAFKNHYKKSLFAKIEDEGLNKAKMHVLDVLLKLRQICDSPAILNTEKKFENNSVKINELLRNIKEKTGNHKILVFSQFVQMLQLIKDKLDAEHIQYSYLDGATKNRKEAIETFQQENDCRVMLISLKAGGLGLNLMEADYVYLVDPWWNPAVEQQAIDRTHRIGQDKHVIAYKMICRDTVEEKILNLQSRKKSLADDLITAEDNFVKKLSVEDIKAILE